MRVSWPVEVAPECPFPITNIPFGVFSTADLTVKRVGVAIGEYILDLARLEEHGLFQDYFNHQNFPNGLSSKCSDRREPLFSQSTLNNFAALPSTIRSVIRTRIINLLQDSYSILFNDPSLNDAAFHKQNESQMHLPMQIGDFTDFMCSREHVNNCSLLAGASGAPSNFYAFPTAYNGRASSIVISGTSISRPRGMLLSNVENSTSEFSFLPSQKMDFEMELGFFMSQPVPFGRILNNPEEAKDHIFGFVLLNDWSARDMQFAEMVPLGPFNGKGSATTISPWVITLDALAGSEVQCGDGMAREKTEKLPGHLKHVTKKTTWNIDVETTLKRKEFEATTISSSNLADLYWSPAQMLSHHASSGCGLRTGDLLGTGTISSLATESCKSSSLGCLYELTAAGTNPFLMSNGDTVNWLRDGDEVTMTGKIVASDGGIIGFGNCMGKLESPRLY